MQEGIWEGEAVSRNNAYASTSPGENSSNMDDKTSSESVDVRREVTRPKPLAADHRTTVSWDHMPCHINNVKARY